MAYKPFINYLSRFAGINWRYWSSQTRREQSSNALFVGKTGMPLGGVFQQKLVMSCARVMSQAMMHIQTWSSQIVHELFNGSSEYNEQPYSGEKCLPCPDGIKSLATLFRPWDQLDYLCRNWKLRRVFLNSFQAGQGRRVHQQFTTPLWCRYRRHEVESELLAPR